MKTINTQFSDMPIHEQVIVKYNGIKYIADESAIRWLQLEVLHGRIDCKEIEVYDIDTNNNLYRMEWRKDGRFINEFTCNICSLNSSLAISLITSERKIPIDELDLSIRAINALNSEGIRTKDELISTDLVEISRGYPSYIYKEIYKCQQSLKKTQ